MTRSMRGDSGARFLLHDGAAGEFGPLEKKDL